MFLYKRIKGTEFKVLLLGMLGTVSIFPDCRSPAFFERTVTMPTVRVARFGLGADHRFGAT